MAFTGLLACRYVLPAADRLEARLAAGGTLLAPTQPMTATPVGAHARRMSPTDSAAPAPAPLPIQVGPSAITINRNDRFVVCQPDGRIADTAAEGFFARDTRFVSGWDLLVNGRRPVLLNSSPIQFFSSRFEFTNGPLVDDQGVIEPSSLSIRVDRTVSEGVHEDYTLVNYSRRAVRLTIELEVNSDFADIFEVKSGDIVRRGEINTRWFRSRRELRTSYVNRVFRQELILDVEKPDSSPQFANGRLVFVAVIQPKQVWHTCLRWLPVFDGGRRPTTLDCNAIAAPFPEIGRVRLPHVRLEAPNSRVVRAWDQAMRDLEALRLEDTAVERGVIIPAAGVPWFVTLFGRDSLIVSIQTISGHPEFAVGALRRLSQLQATDDDPERDMEPGKIPHEVRHGELTLWGSCRSRRTTARTTRPASSSSCCPTSTTGSATWTSCGATCPTRRRPWPGSTGTATWTTTASRSTARARATATTTRRGRMPATRSSTPTARSRRSRSGSASSRAMPTTPRSAWPSLVRALERPKDARRLRAQAHRLYERFNETFWWEDEGTYYLGLDGSKKPIRSVGVQSRGTCSSRASCRPNVPAGWWSG